MNTKPTIGVISLGCPKALVDSERILTQLRSEGYHLTAHFDEAKLIIINTCGFIEAAIEESLDTIGEALEKNGKVIVTGCLGKDASFIQSHYPNVLAVSGPSAYESVMQAVHQHLPPVHEPLLDLVPAQGIKLTPKHYAYLKISEGCNHSCSFCVIPSMRGKLVSRTIGDVLQEAENLVQAGVKELLVISQDTGAYGIDTKYKMDFWNGKPLKSNCYDLAKELGKMGVWVRMHYLYPYPHIDRLIPLMSDQGILPYLDIPFQHASHAVLKQMRRPASQEKILERIQSWREQIPHIAIRSTFIVGFPGETEQDFEQLLEFVKEAKLDRLGAFQYSDVDGADSKQLPNKVDEQTKQERYEELMQTQEEISAQQSSNFIGKTMTILIDEINEDMAIGRSYRDAPEIDGVVYLDHQNNHQIGDWVEVTITHADVHDLYAKVV